MKNYFRIILVTVAVVTLGGPVTAQPRGRGGFSGGVVVEDNSPRPQAFSVSLVLGDMQTAASAPDNVPPAARRALTDVKDFLPYKGYRLLDSQWTLCCGRPSMVSTPIVTRLRGPEDRDYSVEIVPSNAGSGKYYVHFSLWEPRSTDRVEIGSPTPSAAAANIAQQRVILEQQRGMLEQQLAELKKTHGDDHPDVVRLRRRLESLDSQSVESRRDDARRTLTGSLARRAIIDTSFTMDVGETVVVGTSRVGSDKAIIALLTAVASTKSTTK